MKDENMARWLAQAIIAEDTDAMLGDEVATWAEVGRLLDLRFSDSERQDVIWLRKARHDASRFATMGTINAGTKAKMDALLAAAAQLRRIVVDPLSRPGMALMAKAGMLEMEVREWRQPGDYLP